MLEADTGAFYLAHAGLTAQLSDQFGALRQARCAERMAFRKKTA